MKSKPDFAYTTAHRSTRINLGSQINLRTTTRKGRPETKAGVEVIIVDSPDGIVVTLADRDSGLTTATIMYSAHSQQTVAWTEYREEDMVYECEECGMTYNEEQLTAHCGECGSDEILHTSEKESNDD